MIELKNAQFGYSRSMPVLDQFSVQFPSGQTTCLLGPSGSGKTTIVKLICGLISLDSGSVLLPKKDDVLDTRIKGLMFQDDTLVPWLTAMESVVFPNSPSDPSIDRDRIQKLIEQVGLSGAENKLTHELSAGMKKRLEFVRATFNDDECLVADEPFSGLDYHNRRVLWNIWLSNMNTRPRTSVLVTHDLEEAFALADKICVLSSVWPLKIVYQTPNRYKGWFKDDDYSFAQTSDFTEVKTSLRPPS